MEKIMPEAIDYFTISKFKPNEYDKEYTSKVVESFTDKIFKTTAKVIELVKKEASTDENGKVYDIVLEKDKMQYHFIYPFSAKINFNTIRDIARIFDFATSKINKFNYKNEVKKQSYIDVQQTVLNLLKFGSDKEENLLNILNDDQKADLIEFYKQYVEKANKKAQMFQKAKNAFNKIKDKFASLKKRVALSIATCVLASAYPELKKTYELAKQINTTSRKSKKATAKLKKQIEKKKKSETIK